jgi:lysophospholipase L1-like esterase
MFNTSYFKTLVALGAVVLCAGWLPAADPNAPIRPQDYEGQIRVACVGDSITAGVGAAQGQSYPAQLGALLGDRWEVRNFGVSGSTLLNRGDKPYQKEKAFQAALQSQPQVVIIKLGTNDTKPQNWKFKDQFAADYQDLVRQFAALPSKPRIFVCHPVPVPGKGNFGINEPALQEAIPMIDQVAQETKSGVIDMYGALRDQPDLLPDRVHPNTAGATRMAEAAYQVLTGKAAQNATPKTPAKKAA